MWALPRVWKLSVCCKANPGSASKAFIKCHGRSYTEYGKPYSWDPKGVCLLCPSKHPSCLRTLGQESWPSWRPLHFALPPDNTSWESVCWVPAWQVTLPVAFSNAMMIPLARLPVFSMAQRVFCLIFVDLWDHHSGKKHIKWNLQNEEPET